MQDYENQARNRRDITKSMREGGVSLDYEIRRPRYGQSPRDSISNSKVFLPHEFEKSLKESMSKLFKNSEA